MNVSEIPAPDQPLLREPRKSWFEPAIATLMAIASLSTAWCSYQSSRWSGQASGLSSAADKLQRLALVEHLEAQQIEAVQTRALMEMVDAHLAGDGKRERFFTERFSDELKPAFEKWMALKPFENTAAPPHPFVRELYTPRFEGDIRAKHSEAIRTQADANKSAHIASSYLSNTVILAMVLFLAGTASKFDQRRVRWASLVFALGLFSYVAVRTLLLPVAFIVR